MATILSAQCTDRKVNEITAALFKKYRSAADFAVADRPALERAIRQTGFFRNKAKHIIAAARIICAEHGGQVPDTMEQLVKLPGVARKTANIVLSSAFGKAEGIAVDTHVKRLSEKLGLSSEKNPDRIERELMQLFSRRDWMDINYLLVRHGRSVCIARRPRCTDCVLLKECPSSAVAKRHAPTDAPAGR